ncbi:hypothetical protein H490_0104020 [Leucobacter sp. UCD-THU]|uniref:hypothetical protein n=1 Tax=Leucobacter sp. UCD-THU TaxID=1292023 RepID=UPI00036F9A1B|nr:hypothetical protein [Leucobacter sp. UCD-THU]EYT55805.1 hypothetical protein H490_0104020 [Leucobacter sp. UCD-THU]
MPDLSAEKVWKEADGYAEAAGRDDDRSAWSGVFLRPGAGSKHHRKLRSRGVEHAPSNLVCLTGDGTRGEHGWVHAHPREATVLGYMVHSWDDPREVPIYRLGQFGAGLGWYLQDDDAQLTPCDPPIDYSLEEIAEAMALFEELFIEQRRAAPGLI